MAKHESECLLSVISRFIIKSQMKGGCQCFGGTMLSLSLGRGEDGGNYSFETFVTIYQTIQCHKRKIITQIFTAVKISNLIKSHDNL
jgi:hypothetical protein